MNVPVASDDLSAAARSPFALKKKSATTVCLGIAAALFLCAPAFGEELDEEAEATPYRPTVSNPAALSAPGWLEVELGFLDIKNPDSTRTKTAPYILKYAFSKDFGVLLGGDSHMVQVDPDRRRTSGYGDTLLLFKHRWGLSDPDDAFGLEWGAKIPTAQNGLGSGASDTIINGIYSTEVVGTTIDFNLGVTRLGSVAQGEGAHQWSGAIAVSRALNDKWIAAFEIAGTRRTNVTPTSQLLATVAYVVNKRFVVDVGMAKGIHAKDDMVFAGMTYLLEKLHD